MHHIYPVHAITAALPAPLRLLLRFQPPEDEQPPPPDEEEHDPEEAERSLLALILRRLRQIEEMLN